MRSIITFIFIILITPLFSQTQIIPRHPESYTCFRTTAPIVIDGKLDELDWQKAEWTNLFVDIEGGRRHNPEYETRAKMLWDDEYLYIAAWMEEPHIWATLTERESVIFHDNDFEVFIDPDGDTHNYLELEVNAYNTQWDLLLLKPYRDSRNNVAIDNWNINGLKTAVDIQGTVNDASDIDKGWSVEIAIPFDAIIELNDRNRLPIDNEYYRVNFSRVEWRLEIENGEYKKEQTLEDGKLINLPEQNWVWSPQGVIAMHQPETWGYLIFSTKIVGTENAKQFEDLDFKLKMALRVMYNMQLSYFSKNNCFTNNLNDLKINDYIQNLLKNIEIDVTKSGYEAVIKSTNTNKTWHITQDGRIWTSKYNKM